MQWLYSNMLYMTSELRLFTSLYRLTDSHCDIEHRHATRSFPVSRIEFFQGPKRCTRSETPLVPLERIVTEDIKKEHIAAGQPKVAFSAALRTSGSGYIGPFNTHTPLQYKRVFSNFGSGYNAATGVFTAMVKGVYYFRYTMFYNGNANAVMVLMKNEEFLVSTWDATSGSSEDSASNAAIVQLEVGDNVFARLSANRRVYDDGGNYNTFSGFLLFIN
uniref:C1q domain-containing protein n=1 Tax=Oncorhynchus kisutch TaxID=8019 RepID=A0A8C7IRU1_ONCKI